MSLEDRLIEKSYYKTFLKEDDATHPIQVLGELYMAEQQNEVPNLSYIRYAQGEVYFQIKTMNLPYLNGKTFRTSLRLGHRKTLRMRIMNLSY